MQSRQEKAHNSNTIQKKSTETATKASAATPSATRVPTWANTWDNNLPAGLSLDDSTLTRQDASANVRLAPSLMAPMAPFIQRAPLDSAPAPTTTPATPAVNTQNTSTTATDQTTVDTAADSPIASPLIIEDDATDLKLGQMKRTEFLTALREDVCKTADEALAGTIWSSVGCPWVTYWFGYYGNRSSQQVEKAIRRYTSEAANVTDAKDYIPLISTRVRRAIATWATTGEVTGVPEGVPTSVPGTSPGPASSTAAATSGTAPATQGASTKTEGVQLKSSGDSRGNTADPEAIRGQLGEGHSLDGSTQSRMGSAFGSDFSSVRVHTEASDAALSKDLNAIAFTVGNDIAFGPGEYRPGTPVGDALLAHELAHVVQQRGATTSSTMSKSKDDAGYNALEADADQSAFGVIASMWGGAKAALTGIGQNAMPRLQSGLSLRSCRVNEESRSTHSVFIGDTNLLGIAEDPEPGDIPVFVGTYRDVLLRKPAMSLPDVSQGDEYPRVRSFLIRYPSNTQVEVLPDAAGRGKIHFLEAGDTEIRAFVDLGTGPATEFVRNQKVVEPKAYAKELLAEFASLYKRKENIVEGTESPDVLAEVNTRLGEVVAKLHETGLNLDEYGISKALKDGTDLLQVKGRILQTPAGPLVLNQRATFDVQLDYVPPGRKVEVMWWLILDDLKIRYGRSENRSLQLDYGFWTSLLHREVLLANTFKLKAEIYLGDDSVPQTLLTTDVKMVKKGLPEKLTLLPTILITFQGAILHFTIAEWVTDPDYIVIWDVDGKEIPSSQDYLEYQFDTDGKRTITANIYYESVSKNSLVRTASTTIDVQKPEKYSEKLFEQAASEKLPSLGKVEASIPGAIEEFKQREAKGEEAAAYWKDRREAQEKRLENFKRNVPSQQGAKPLPEDEASLVPGNRYSMPIPTFLLMHETGEAQPISIYLTAQQEGEQWTARILDVTGTDVFLFDGSGDTPRAAFEAAFRYWIGNNPYPRGGTVVYKFSPRDWNVPQSFSTDRFGKTVKAWLDGALSVGAIIIGALLLAAPEPTTLTKWLGYIILAASVARSTYAIYENIKLGMAPTDARNILEGVSIVTAFAGISGSVLARQGFLAARPLMFHVGNWLVLGSLISDAGTLVYASAKAIQAIEIAASDPTRDDGQKAMDILRIISTTVFQGALFFTSNRKLFSEGLRRSDYLPTDPEATAKAIAGQPRTGKVELEPGARVDLAAELRRAGDLPETLTKLPNRDLVDRYMALNWLKTAFSANEIEGVLKRLSTDTIVSLRAINAEEAKSLFNKFQDKKYDALLNELIPKLGGSRFQSLVNTVGVARTTELHAVFGEQGVLDLVDALGIPAVDALMQGFPDASAVKELYALSQKVGNKPLKNLADLSGPKIKKMVDDHGADTIVWLATDLTGSEVEAMLVLNPSALKGLQDVSSKQAKLLLDQLGKDALNAVSPTVSGKQLTMIVDEQMGIGQRSAKDLVDDIIKRSALGKSKVPKLAEIANKLEAAHVVEQIAPRAVGPNSFVVDSNTLVAIEKLMNGEPWSKLSPTDVKGLAPNEQNAINQIRKLMGLPELVTDPPVRDLVSIVGNAELIAPNVVLGEKASFPGLTRSRVDLTVERNSAEYLKVLDALKNPPAAKGSKRKSLGEVGTKRGVVDRAAVADALFARTTGTSGPPRFVTADEDVYARLAFFGPDDLVPKSGSVTDAIKSNPKYANGFVATIEGKQLLVVPGFPP